MIIPNSGRLRSRRPAVHLTLTVQVHLTSIFAKTRVRSRRELIGKIFARHYRNGLTGPADGGR